MQYKIVPWNDNIDTALIDAFICNIQKIEFHLLEPEKYNFCLWDMKKHYMTDKQVNFFIAFSQKNIVGCIGIRPISQYESELRKFYVSPEHRKNRLGQMLFEHAMEAAKNSGFKKIFTGTMGIKIKAQNFYIKNQFKAIDITSLPSSFKTQKLDEKFYVRDLIS